MARQIIELMDDMHLSSQSTFLDYYYAMQANNVSDANSILANNPSVANQIMNSENINEIIDRINKRELQPKIDIDYFLAGLHAVFEKMILYTQVRGEWQEDIEYNVHNFVYYQGKGYFVYTNTAPPKGTLPTDNRYWLEYDIRGFKGYGGFTNLNYLGNWNNTLNYNPGDVVIYQNKLWMANAQNINYAPNLNHYPWSLIMVPEPANKTAIKKTEPIGYNIGDFWFKITEGDDIIQTSWFTKTSESNPRIASGSFKIGNNIYVIGGQDRALSVSNANEVYDTVTNTWSQKADYPVNIDGIVAFAINNKGYCAGGLNSNNIPTNKCYSYDPVANSWTEIADFPILMAYVAPVAVIGNNAYAGGFLSVTGVSGDVYKFSGDTETWSKITEMPIPRYSASVSTVENKLYFIGGGDILGNSYGDTQIYDISTATWSTGATLLTPRSYTGTFVHEDDIYVVGGLDKLQYSTNINEVYDTKTNSWKETIPMTYKRNSLTSQYDTKKGYAIGGIDIAKVNIGGYVEEYVFIQEDTSFEMIIDTTFGNKIGTEDGDSIITEDGNYIIRENSASVTDTKTISIPMVQSGTYNYWVDWGDGTTSTQITAYDDPQATHTYVADGVYTIKINGTLSQLVFTGTIANDLREVTKCELNLSAIDSMFKDCNNLQAISDGIFSNSPSLSSANSTFEGCSSLSVLPMGLFDNNIGILSFANTFKNSGITNIPIGLFNGNNLVRDFSGTFENCSSLVSIPNNLFSNNSLVTTFARTFSGCVSLMSIPNNLLINNPLVQSYKNMFFNDINIKEIPDNLLGNASVSGLTFENMFGGISTITSIPEGIFRYANSSTSFAGVFSNANINIIPLNCFNGNNADWANAFNIDNIITLEDNSLLGLNITSDMFKQSNLVTVGDDVFWSKDTDIVPNNPTELFNNCLKLQTLGNLNLKAVPSNVSLNNMFTGCISLTDIAGFKYGENEPSLGSDISFTDCPLTHGSLVNIIDSLVTNTPATIRTLTLGNRNLGLLTDVEKLEIINKYWNLPGYNVNMNAELAQDLVLAEKGQGEELSTEMYQETSLYYYVKLFNTNSRENVGYYGVDKQTGYVYDYDNMPIYEYYIKTSTNENGTSNDNIYWISKTSSNDTDASILKNKLQDFNNENILRIEIGNSSNQNLVIKNTGLGNVLDLSELFKNFSYVKNIGIYDSRESQVINMKGMFQLCTNLRTVTISELDISRCTDMSYLFSGCTNITNMLNIPMDNVQDISYMYSNTGLTSVLGGIFKNKIKKAEGTFYECKKLVNLPSDYTTIFGENNVLTNVNQLFKDCTSLEKVGEQPIKEIQHEQYIEYAFDKTKAKNQILGKCPNVTSASAIFCGTAITDIPIGIFYNNLELIDVSYAFCRCKDMIMYAGGESVGAFDTYNNLLKNNTKLVSIKGLFDSCSSLEYFGIETTDGTNAYSTLTELEDASFLYSGSGIDDMLFGYGFPENSPKLKTVRGALSGTNIHYMPTWASSNAASIFPALEDCNMLFYNCTNLGSFDYGDTQTKAMPFINSVTSLSSFTTGQSAFYNCTSIKDYNEIPNEWKAK